MDGGVQRAVDRRDPRFDGKYVKFADVVFTPKPVQQPIPIWVGGESAPALRRIIRYADCWYPVGTNPQFPMNTVTTFKAGLERFHGFASGGGRDPRRSGGTRVFVGPRIARGVASTAKARCSPAATADYVGDIKALQDLGVNSVDVRLFATTLEATIDNMRRFRDEVMAKVR